MSDSFNEEWSAHQEVIDDLFRLPEKVGTPGKRGSAQPKKAGRVYFCALAIAYRKRAWNPDEVACEATNLALVEVMKVAPTSPAVHGFGADVEGQLHLSVARLWAFLK